MAIWEWSAWAQLYSEIIRRSRAPVGSISPNPRHFLRSRHHLIALNCYEMTYTRHFLAILTFFYNYATSHLTKRRIDKILSNDLAILTFFTTTYYYLSFIMNIIILAKLERLRISNSNWTTSMKPWNSLKHLFSKSKNEWYVETSSGVHILLRLG